MQSSYQPSPQVEARIQKLGKDFWQGLSKDQPGLFNQAYWQGKLMDLVMRDKSFKVDLFRFVDLLPMLKDNQQILDHVRQYLFKDGRSLPGLLQLSKGLFENNLTGPLAALALKKNITGLGKSFIVGTDEHKALAELGSRLSRGLGFTADLLGEAALSDQESLAYQKRYLDLIARLPAFVAQQKPPQILVKNHLGDIPLANVSLKISALDSQIDAADLAGSVARLKERVLPILELAQANRVFINFDLEQWEYHWINYCLFEEVSSLPQFKNWPHLGLVVQAYLQDADQDLDFLLSLAQRRGTPFTVRLVKGAYWDYEVIQSQLIGREVPVLTHKHQSDAQYEALSHRLLSNLDHLHPAFASHNLRSLAHALETAKDLGLPPEALEVQMLNGMGEPLYRLFTEKGIRLRLYSPIGELLPGIAYLVRRLLENTSNSGFLRQGFAEGKSIQSLMQSPHQAPSPKAPSPEPEFANCPLLDFAQPEASARFHQAIEDVRASLPLKAPVLLAGKEVPGLDQSQRTSPEDPNLVVTKLSQGSELQAEEAVLLADKAWPAWRDQSLESRAACLEKLAGLLAKERYHLAAKQVFEVGKPWREADADVAEAIDFCRYYAGCARRELAPRPMGQLAGEANQFFYQGRGVVLVLAPWNFPLAILTGMTAAALVAGNSVIVKPSSLSAGVGFDLIRLAHQAGVPPACLHYLPGPGAKLGDFLARHPKVVQIAFTGSKEVGLNLLQIAGQVRPGQFQVKRMVCEMGGKNANIIDDDADLDQAVSGVIKGAFGFAGQKCSACSRAIVLEKVYDSFVARLQEAASSLLVAAPSSASCRLGPVVDKAAYDRLWKVIQNPGPGAKLLFRGQVPEQGWFVPATLFEVKDPDHGLFQKELFGPILTLIKAKDFDQALVLAANSEFALTGSLFSRNPEHIERAKREFRVGNLYINQKSTGALVHRQPFGGFGMSGLGTKAGGPGYVTLFADARAITENNLRQGFSPELLL